MNKTFIYPAKKKKEQNFHMYICKCNTIRKGSVSDSSSVGDALSVSLLQFSASSPEFPLGGVPFPLIQSQFAKSKSTHKTPQNFWT